MSCKKPLLLISGLLLSTLALANPPRLPPVEPPASGQDARAWLDLQKSGQASAPAPQPMPGEVADKVYRRWLDSHERPIPERLSREGVSGGPGR